MSDDFDKRADELLKELEPLAQSPESAQHRPLRSSLAKEEVLYQLDSRDYDAPVKQMRIATLLFTLMDNPSAAAQQTLDSLTQSPVFMQDENYQELLIQALAIVRPATSGVVEYWRPHVRAGALFRHYAVDAICLNGTDPAAELLESVFLNPKHEVADITIWMRDPLLKNRHNMPLLRMSKRLLDAKEFPVKHKFLLLEGLYQYKPDEWYVTCTQPQPPEDITQEAIVLRREILGQALRELELPADDRAPYMSLYQAMGGRREDVEQPVAEPPAKEPPVNEPGPQ